MREEIRSGHRAAALLANGGKLNPSAQGKLGATVRAQYEYLARFSSAIQNGEVSLDKSLVARAKMYAQAARPGYENQVRLREQNAGMKSERRLLSPVESCADCVAAAGEGWQLIGTLPQIGDSICKVNCHCRFEYKGEGEPPRPATAASGADARARLAEIANEVEQETQARHQEREQLQEFRPPIAPSLCPSGASLGSAVSAALLVFSDGASGEKKNQLRYIL